MISYSLRCGAGHAFEAWFRSSADFERQSGLTLVTCPNCGSTEVSKALMAPNVARTDRERPAPVAAPAAEPAPTMVAPDPRMRALVETMRELRRQVLATAEDTGTRFPEEARRIHHGEAEERGIYGQASAEEVKALLEEGIAIAPLPVLPDDFN